MLLAILFVFFHLVLSVNVAESLEWTVYLRGIISNFLLGWSLGFMINLIKPTYLKISLYLFIIASLSLAHSHVLINGAYPLLQHANLAIDSGFLASILIDYYITVRLLIYLLLGLLAIYLSQRMMSRAFLSPKIKIILFSVCALPLLILSFCLSCQTNVWQANNVVAYNISSWLKKDLSNQHTVLDGRTLLKKETGQPLYPAVTSKNVILVLIEGLSHHYVDAGHTPEIATLSHQGLLVKNFITHQRQTNRGLFSMLCGAYPNLIKNQAKSDLMALSNLQQHCLPQYLADRGINNVFLQSTDMGYMSLDLFADKAGFNEWIGEKQITNPRLKTTSGVDDYSLYQHTLRYLDNNPMDQGYFLTLLTSSTHQPYHTPVSKGDKNKAFQYASESFAYFYQALKNAGHLKNTVLILSSDESSIADTDKGDSPIAANEGFLLVLGEQIKPMINKGLFGQVDMALSILDIMGIHDSDFSGRSFFQSFNSPRTLYAGNTFKQSLYIFEQNGFVECNYDFNCQYKQIVKSPEYSIKVSQLEKYDQRVLNLIDLLLRNELDHHVMEKYLVSLPERSYQGQSMYRLIGRYISSEKVGSQFILQVEIDNNLAGESKRNLVVEWLTFDCTEKSKHSWRKQWLVPAGEENFKITAQIPQIHPALCHKAFVYAEDKKITSEWTLKKLSLEPLLSAQTNDDVM